MIDYDVILTNVGRHVELDAEETDYFISLLKLRRLPRKALLLKEGQACNYFYYVHSGALRAYFDLVAAKATLALAGDPEERARLLSLVPRADERRHLRRSADEIPAA